MNLVRVALDVPVATLFDYTVKVLGPELQVHLMLGCLEAYQ